MVLFVMLVVVPAVQAGTTTVVVFTAYDPYYGTGVNFVSEQPSNNSWVEVYDHNLTVTVSNDLGETMNVSFYWASNDSLIEKDEDVLNNTIAYANSSFNYTHYQNYTWYVVINSTHYNNQSAIWRLRGESYDWDINRDAEVDINDITSVTGVYGSEGSPHWIKQDCAPLGNPDGEIDIKDITLITAHYGEIY